MVVSGNAFVSEMPEKNVCLRELKKYLQHVCFFFQNIVCNRNNYSSVASIRITNVNAPLSSDPPRLFLVC